MDVSSLAQRNDRLRQERIQRNWRQQDMADLVGTSVVTVKRWERGNQQPSAYFRVKLCALFDKSAEELGFSEEEATQNNAAAAEQQDFAALDQDTDDADMITKRLDKMTQSVGVASEKEQHGEMQETAIESAEEPLRASAPKGRLQRRTLIVSAWGAVLATCMGSGIWWGAKAMQQHTATPHPPSPAITTLYSAPRHPAYTMNDVDWSPHGDFIVCAVGDKTIQILHAATGDIALVYRGHSDYTECAKWAPDASRIASSSKDRSVQVWNPGNGSRLLTYRGHSAAVVYLAWSHDGTRIASGGRDSTVQVWDAFSGELISVYRGHQGTAWSLRWSPDGSSIVSGGDDGIVHVWEAASAQPSQTFVDAGPHTSAINEVDWSPDGRQIATAYANGTVSLWDALVGSRRLTYQGHTAAVRTARWSPDGIWMASGGADNTVQIWKALTGKRLLTNTKHHSDVFEVSWSPNGTRLASASNDWTMQVCRIQF